MNRFLHLFIAFFAAIFCLNAQIVTSTPSPLQMASQDVVIYFHADQGNKGLAGVPASTAIYAHTGFLPAGSDKWEGAPDWNKNNDKYKLEYVSPNLWKLNIGDIRTFYGVTDQSITSGRLGFVFRDATGNKTGRGVGGSDIFINVYAEGFMLDFTSSSDAGVISPDNTTVTLTASATRAANLTIAIDGKQIAAKNGATLLTANYTFTTRGSFTATATAVADGQTLTETMTFLYPADAKAEAYPGGAPVMGANRQADGSVLFCLAAPAKENVVIVGSWNDYTPTAASVMNYQDIDGVRYFWTRVSGLDPDTQYMYYYIVDRKTKVGDPYARLVLDPDFDKYIPESVYPNLPKYPTDKVAGVPLAVYHENQDKYAWKVKDFKGVDKDNLIIYELLLRDFTGTEGKADGNGTVRQAIAKIPYLKDLGVNAVELLPINEFNGNISWGYNPNFYFAPDKAYGTPDDYKEFIDKCHKAGIAVILDIVFNQTDWMHPWYAMYEPGQNPFYNASAPHAYSVLNDWNQGYPLVQTQFKDVLKHWLTVYNVDGFRFDLVKGLGDNSSYANNGDAATNAYNASRIARMHELQQAVDAVKPGAYFINENLATAREENEMAAFGQLNWANLNHAALQYGKGLQADSGLEGMYAPSMGRTWGSTVSYLESHDEQRVGYAIKSEGVAGLKGNANNTMRRLGSLAAQMILTPGAHMIWQFSEMGNEESTKNSSGNNTDPKVVCWSLLDKPANEGLHAAYRDLIHARLMNPGLFAKDATFTEAVSTNNWDAGRTIYATDGTDRIICAINPLPTKAATVKVDLQGASGLKILAVSPGVTPELDAAAGTVTLPANAFVVYGTAGTTGIDAPAVEGIDNGEVVATDWFTLTGLRVVAPTAGCYIKVTTYANGRRHTQKVIL